MRTVILLKLFLFAFFKISGQSNYADTLFKINADQYLVNKFGLKFKDKYLNYSATIATGLSVVFYEVNSKKRLDGKNTLLVYFKYESTEVDTSRYVFGRQEIMNCVKGKPCNLFIGREKAKEIAKKAGLPEREQPWEISAHDFGRQQIPKWGISSNRFEHSRSGYWIRINMNDGSTKEGQWSYSH